VAKPVYDLAWAPEAVARVPVVSRVIHTQAISAGRFGGGTVHWAEARALQSSQLLSGEAGCRA